RLSWVLSAFRAAIRMRKLPPGYCRMGLTAWPCSAAVVRAGAEPMNSHDSRLDADPLAAVDRRAVPPVAAQRRLPLRAARRPGRHLAPATLLSRRARPPLPRRAARRSR